MSLVLLMLLYIASEIKGIESLQVTLWPRLASVIENQNINLTCSNNGGLTGSSFWSNSSGLAQAPITYFSNGCTPYGFLLNRSAFLVYCFENGSFVLQLKYVERSQNDLRWTCAYSNDNGQRVESNAVTVYVQVHLTNVDVYRPQETYLKENSLYIIKCNTSACRPQPKVNWYFFNPNDYGRVYLTGNSSQTTTKNSDGLYSTQSLLHFVPTKTVNEWMLYCEAWTNTADSALRSKGIAINVSYAPDGGPTIHGVANGSVFNIKENDLVNLSCSISWGNPLPFLSWNCSGNTFPSTIDKQTVRLDLQWTTERRDKDKICVCSSTHSIAGIQIAMIGINILYSAVIRSFSWIREESREFFVINQSEKVSFICTVEANPASNITIVSPKHEQIIMQSNTNNVSHTFQNTSCENAGEYTCTGRNNFTISEESSSKLILIVRCPPRPSSESTNSKIIATPLHVEVLLQFTSRNYLDIPDKTTFRWFKDNVSLESDNRTFGISSNGLQSNLSIKSITKAKFGKYEIRVSNSVGQYIHVYKVIAKESVETPVESHSLSMTGVVAGSVSSCIVIVAVVIAMVLVYRKRLNQNNEQNVRKTTETVFETENPFTYDELDGSKREGNTYSQVPAAYEPLDNITKDENTYMEMDNTNVKREDSDYINIRI